MATSSVNSGHGNTSAVVVPSFSGTPTITSTKLNGRNYSYWSVAVEIWFVGQALEDHLTSDVPSTLSDADARVWRRVDAQLVSLLWQSIESSLYNVFRIHRTCKSIWTVAKEMYSSQVTRIYDVISSMLRGQSADMGVTEYYSHFQGSMTEFRELFPVSTDPKTIETQWEQLCLVLWLRGLSSEYDAIRSQLLSGSTLPTLREAYARVCRAVPHHDTSENHSDHSALVTNSLGRIDSQFRGGRGRGRNNGGRGGGRSNTGQRSRCSYCNKLGHVRDTCWTLHGRPAGVSNGGVANSAQVETSDNSMTLGDPSSPAPSQSMISIPEAEYSKFLQFQASQQALQSSHASSSIATLAHSGPVACLSHTSSGSSPWIIDSGASDHMSGNINLLSNLRSGSFPNVTLANGSSASVRSIGSVHLTPTLSLSSVLYLPQFPVNLLSVSKLTKHFNCSVTFTPDSVFMQDLKTREQIGTGHERRGLYYLNVGSPTACLVTPSPAQVHSRLGHPSLSNLKKMVPSLSSISEIPCESCQLGKHCRSSFVNRVNKRASAPFALVHSDVWGPCRTTSKTGCRYFVTFIDDYSRMTWLFLMKERSELFSIFTSFCAEIRTQFGVHVKTLRSDNAKEYFSTLFVNFMASQGIIHQSSCSYTPQQNGVAERKNRHLIETARTLLLHMNVPLRFWDDAVLTACYLINRMPSSVLHDQIPFSILFPRDPIYVLPPRVFGCVCFVHHFGPGVDKLGARSIKCIFLGYTRYQKGYRCYSPQLNKLLVCADVTFFESTPYFSSPPSFDTVVESLPLPTPVFTSDSLSIEPPASTSRLDRPDLIVYTRRHRPPPDPVPASSSPSDATREPSCSDLGIPIALRKGTRTCTTKHPISNFVSYKSLSPTYTSFVVSLSSISIPNSVTEALNHPGWRAAMIEEINALHHNSTWELVDLPPGKSLVGCRWVYAVKVSPDGSVDRLKARLVAKGYTQIYGVDYVDTFSPVAKMSSVRIFLSLAAMNHWSLHQLDIKNAFLNGDLDEEVYMEQPPGFVAQGESGKVCRLKKALYGLKQSPRAWFGRFSSAVLEFGLTRCGVDHSVFYRHSCSGKRLLLIVYVDDIIITGDDIAGIHELKKFLHQQFQTKDLGQLRYFLGIEVAQSGQGVFISQRKYTLDMLSEAGMLGARPCDSPMDPNVKLVPDSGELMSDPGRYRRLVGKLNYLTVTRPDISFAVSVVSQFMNSPRESHWEAALRILRYIKATPGQGLLYSDRGHTDIVGYSDADWAGCPIDRRSTSGYCVFVGGNLVSWKSKKQDVVSRSSAESEYRAMGVATCELMWVKQLLTEIGVECSYPMKLVCDNQAAIHIASNPMFHERTKHIEIDCHFIREKLISKEIVTSFVNSNDQLADLFTKSLRGPRVKYICNKLGVYDIYAPA